MTSRQGQSTDRNIKYTRKKNSKECDKTSGMTLHKADLDEYSCHSAFPVISLYCLYRLKITIDNVTDCVINVSVNRIGVKVHICVII